MYVKHDSDGSGCLDIKELSLAFNDILKFMGVNSELTPQEAIDLMKNIDKDQDDKIQRY
jgi:Ca2+-binding EF-hand superfamily protein